MNTREPLITRQKLPGIIRDYILMTIGSACIALALNIFLVPNNVVFGGLTGIATIINSLFGFPIGVTSLVLNIPLFIIGLRRLGGWAFGLRTIYATLMLSLLIDLTAGRVDGFVQKDPLIYTCYGGLLSGLGVGLVFRAGSTTGGVDIVARLLEQWRGVRPGQAMLVMSVLVFLAAGWIYGPEPVLFALLLAFIESRVVDVVIEGFSYLRSAIIISRRPDEIRAVLLHDLGRGVTVLEGRGGYTNQESSVLMCVVTQAEVSVLKKMVAQIDGDAFVVISEAAEVLGEGFRSVKGAP
ncbi:MAG TPA: YitT family protein [Herpetosiphonaceae bacterium]|nr:YitT family protein [Herpetosiphonaceae bacterium]